MRISVITVCRNASDVIETCLRSVSEQTHPDVEHIVIDGGSLDSTVTAIRRYPHVSILISEPDEGIYDAMNKGLDYVTGEYVLFLNADDKFASATALADAVAAISRDPGGHVYYGWLEVRPVDGPPFIFRPPPVVEAPEFMVCGCLPHQSTLTRLSVFSKTGRFDLRYRIHADYDWFLKILTDPTIDVRCLEEVIGSFREGGQSSQLANGQPEVYAIQNQSSLYATREWDKRRIIALQDAFLRERQQSALLWGEVRAARSEAQRSRPDNPDDRNELGQCQAQLANVLSLRQRPARRLVGIKSRVALVVPKGWRSAWSARDRGEIVRAILRSAARPLGRLSMSGALRWPRAAAKLQSQVVARSGLFDERFYLLGNPDLAGTDTSAVAHFLLHGAAEGRKPNRLFDPAFYLHTYPDVAQAGINPLLHYFCFGAIEGRNPSPDFDTRYYLEAYPDVARARINALVHFLQYGEQEGRLCRPPAAARVGREIDKEGDFSRILHQTRVNRIMQQQQQEFGYRPLISLLVPTYNTKPLHLESTVRSVLKQAYTNWELRIVDDGSTSAETHAALDRITEWDRRIHITRIAQKCGISCATNTALGGAQGEYVAMLDHDDELTNNALFEVVRALNAEASIDVVYTDQDYMTPDGSPERYLFKPEWSPHLFRGVMFVGHLLTVRRTLALEVGGFDPAYDCVQDYEFMLRVSERTKKIRHVPKVLYHCRRIPESVAGGGEGDVGIERLQASAVQAHLHRQGLSGRATPHSRHPHRVAIEPEVRRIGVSIELFVNGHAAPSANLAAIEEAIAQTTHRPVRVVVPSGFSDRMNEEVLLATHVTNHSDSPLDEADQLRCFLDKATAEFVVVISAGLTIEPTNWLERLLLATQESDVMAVCGSILTPNGLISNAGLIVGRGAELRPAMYGFHPDGDGYAGSLSCAREVSAVSAEIVVLRRSAVASYLSVIPAYRSADFLVADLVLRATQSGLRAICVPQVRARCQESSVRHRFDTMVFKDIWESELSGDRYYNPNFRNHRADYT
jgi:glycosyltransferase involved in cell wall biosynthesis